MSDRFDASRREIILMLPDIKERLRALIIQYVSDLKENDPIVSSIAAQFPGNEGAIALSFSTGNYNHMIYDYGLLMFHRVYSANHTIDQGTNVYELINRIQISLTDYDALIVTFNEVSHVSIITKKAVGSPDDIFTWGEIQETQNAFQNQILPHLQG